MSAQAVQDFVQKAQSDPALQRQLQGVKSKDKNATIAGLVKIAAAAGFAFTAQEWRAAVKEELARRHAAAELSEEQLSLVAGGCCWGSWSEAS